MGVMDEAWEQWLKEAAESGGIPYLPAELSPNANIPGTRPAVSTNYPVPSRLMNAARMGQWSQIPESLHNVIRQQMSDNNRRTEGSQLSFTTTTPGSRNINPLLVPRPSAPASSSRSPFARPSSTPSTASSPFQSRSSLGPRSRIVPAAMTSARESRSSGRVTITLDSGTIGSNVSYTYVDTHPRTSSWEQFDLDLHGFQHQHLAAFSNPLSKGARGIINWLAIILLLPGLFVRLILSSYLCVCFRLLYTEPSGLQALYLAWSFTGLFFLILLVILFSVYGFRFPVFTVSNI